MRGVIGPRRALVLLGIAVGVAVVMAAQFGAVPETGRASRTILSVIGGHVGVRLPAGAARAARDGEVLPAGATVYARSPAGRSVLTFADGSTVELEPGATIAIEEAAIGDRGEQRVRLRQDVGRTWSHVQPLISPSSRFMIATPNGTAVVRGTSFELDVARAAGGPTTTSVSVFDGQVDLVAAGEVRTVQAREVTEVVGDRAPAATRRIALSPVCLHISATGAVMVTATDPVGRSVGQIPVGTVSQIPRASVSGPQVETQTIDVSSPFAGEWEIGLLPRGDGGAFQLTFDMRTGAGHKTLGLLGVTAAGQGSVARIRLDERGTVDTVGSTEGAATRANIAILRVGNTTTAVLPQAKRFAPSAPAPSPACE